ncbi:MAG: tetratricopeptide repeat protein [Candidatus Hydrogenedentes bacterium]|nr:tetratricopeptide repeat protein [Candidatus Hydrogenedentota bacterium]
MQQETDPTVQSKMTPDESAEDSVAVGALAVTGVLFVLFVAGVYAYATYGGPFVNRLSGELGEVIAARGVTAQEAGQTDDAIRAYQLALQKGFSEPRQKYWTQIRLAEVLLQTDQYTEASEYAREAIAFDNTDSKLHYVLTASLWQAKHLDEALAATDAWLDLVRPKGGRPLEDALWYRGMIYMDLGQRDIALEVFLEGARLDPKDRSSYHAAAILHDLGRDKEAIALLDAYIPSATDARAELAKKLRDAIGTPGPSN